VSLSSLIADLATRVGQEIKAVRGEVATGLSGKAATSHTHAESDVAGLTTALAGKVPTSRTVSAGTGLTGGGDLTADRSLAVSYGTSAGTACQGNDSRLSDARTPTSHTHAESDVTNLVADLAAKVPTSRTITASTGLSGGGDLSANRSLSVSFGTTSTTACVGNDSRLSDSRTPTGTAGGALNGTYPNPGLKVVPWAPVNLTDAATIATDASQGTTFRVTIAADRTLGAPTNPTDGQRGLWVITASGGNRTLTLATGAGGFAFGTDITGPLTATVSGTTDYIGAVYVASANRWRVLAVAKGY